MSRTTRIRRRKSPGSYLLLFLVATLGVSLALGYHALATARSHRDSVENVLRDYASVAAWQFSLAVRERLSVFLGTVFYEVTRGWRGYGELPSPELLSDEMQYALRRQECSCLKLLKPIAFFRLDLLDSSMVSYPDTLAEDFLARLASTVRHNALEQPRTRLGIVKIAADSLLESTILVTYSTSYERRAVTRALYGFIANPNAYGELLAKWYGKEPLLPHAVTGGQPNDSLLHMTVRAGDDAILFKSGHPVPTVYQAQDTLATDFETLIVEAAIRPDVADQLIIGGVPRSRLPVIFTLLLLTVGLGAAALVQLRRERQLARLRDDFVSGVSHELRTPLAQVRMFAELLDSGRLRTEAERSRSLDVINREALRLSNLVDNILRFSRSGRAAVDLKMESLDVAATVHEVIEAFRPLAIARANSLDSDVEANLTLRADRDAVSQILINLLDNAVKYGPEGQTVRVHAARSGNTLRLCVDDEGPGVPRSERRHIWEPYRRLEGVSKQGIAGTGIGLAIVGQLVDLHGGSIGVEEAPSGGARFVVELPGATRSSERGSPETAGVEV